MPCGVVLSRLRGEYLFYLRVVCTRRQCFQIRRVSATNLIAYGKIGDLVPAPFPVETDLPHLAIALGDIRMANLSEVMILIRKPEHGDHLHPQSLLQGRRETDRRYNLVGCVDRTAKEPDLLATDHAERRSVTERSDIRERGRGRTDAGIVFAEEV